LALRLPQNRDHLHIEGGSLVSKAINEDRESPQAIVPRVDFVTILSGDRRSEYNPAKVFAFGHHFVFAARISAGATKRGVRPYRPPPLPVTEGKGQSFFVKENPASLS
jgi:hypothetical protein